MQCGCYTSNMTALLIAINNRICLCHCHFPPAYILDRIDLIWICTDLHGLNTNFPVWATSKVLVSYSYTYYIQFSRRKHLVICGTNVEPWFDHYHKPLDTSQVCITKSPRDKDITDYQQIWTEARIPLASKNADQPTCEWGLCLGVWASFFIVHVLYIQVHKLTEIHTQLGTNICTHCPCNCRSDRKMLEDT